ncbi:Uncharacterized protein HZ326_15828 [Fusarium oxysporum f. sp. albedinis]|nr:Uncharacterized protein HZ326_15828 [Fusarium oxysporum f. sp. albedinis]
MRKKIPRACAHENANGSIAANQGVNVRGFNNKRAASGSGCSGDPCSLVLMGRLPPRACLEKCYSQAKLETYRSQPARNMTDGLQ